MIIVGIFEAKRRLSELVDRAGRGEEIVITRRGQPVARLLSPEAAVAYVQAGGLAERLRRTPSAHALGGGVSLRELKEENRR